MKNSRDLILGEVVYIFFISIGKRDLTNAQCLLTSCRSENRISLAGLRKYFTLFSWHRPRFALSIRSIRSIDSFDSSNGESLAGLRKYFTLFLWLAPVLLCRFDRFVRFVEWGIFIDDPTSGVVDRKIASH